MRGVDALIATVFIILISIVGIAIVLESSQPSVGRLQEISLFDEAKNILAQIDNAVRDVSQEGEGSTRVLQISVSGGSYFIDTDKDAVIFSMDSRSQIVGVGVSKTEGNINMFGELNKVFLNISYSNINVTDGGRFGRGYHSLTIRNNGYDSINQKQIISISTLPPVLPPTALTNQYNQFGNPYIVSGNTPSGNVNDLNILGEGLTYDISEASQGGGAGTHQRRPNSYQNISSGCSNLANAYNFDGLLASCDITVITEARWWNNTPIQDLGTITSAKVGVRLNSVGMRATKNPDDYQIDYGYASTFGDCGTVGTWNTITSNSFPGSTLTFYNLSITNPTLNNINNICWRFYGSKNGADDGYIIYIDAFFIEVNYSIPITYRVEVWHNSTQISYSGILDSINVTLNFTTNVSDDYSLQIYNFANSHWTNCSSGNVLANTPTKWWCNENINPTNYISQENKVRIRINSTANINPGLLKEDYVQYYINYIP